MKEAKFPLVGSKKWKEFGLQLVKEVLVQAMTSEALMNAAKERLGWDHNFVVQVLAWTELEGWKLYSSETKLWSKPEQFLAVVAESCKPPVVKAD